jgi:hypothetical protein
LVILGLVAAVIVLPYQYGKTASKRTAGRPISKDSGLPYYDIRSAAQEKGAVDLANTLASWRTNSGNNAAAVASIRDSFVRGEAALRSRVPTLKVDYNDDIRTPEVIGPDPKLGAAFLTSQTSPAGTKHADALVSFLKQNNSLIGSTDDQVSQLKVAADYTNPNGILSFVELDQEINGIPVFRGEVKAGFAKSGEMVRVVNNFAPGLDYNGLSTDFGDPTSAVKAAADNLGYKPDATEVIPNTAFSSDLKVRFGNGGDWDITAEKMYFPTEPGVARTAWRILIWEPTSAYYVIVDAQTGTILWRKNISNDQTQSATFNVYSATNNIGNAMDSPSPGSPGPTDPTTLFQAGLGSRTSVTLIGNEGNLSFNNDGWITDGGNETDGNNVEAGLDRDTTNGVDTTNGRAQGTNRTFNFSYTPSNVSGGVPPPTGTESGDNPVPAGEPTPGVSNTNICGAITQPHGITEAQKGAITNLFYLDNRYHDALYQVGFTESAKNFQNDNFGRGGVAGDRVSAEVDDCSGDNNANFATPADGGRGRMQMYLFNNGTAPFRDGSLDSSVVWHEHTHGVSNRLIGNGSGLGTTQAGGMGEGWSDLYAFLLLSKTSDTANGVYPTGAYVTYKCCGLPTFTQNYYYGIRRFPYAVKSFTGGAQNRPHDPLTFADIDPAQLNGNDGAFPCSALTPCSGGATEVHNEGEIWAVTGVEVWSRFIARLGHDPGTQRTLQFYTDGMKLSPLNPTFLQERDALLAAAQAGGTAADVSDIWAAFATRGMGFSASNPSGNTVVETFDLPNVVLTNPFTVDDTPGNHNGVPEPGENVLLGISVTNTTGLTISSVTVNVNGGTNVNYGTINNGQTITNNIPFTIPNVACGSTQSVTININSSAGPQTPQIRSFVLGTPQGLVESFDGVTAPNLPAGWTTTQDNGTGITWGTSSTGPDTPPNSAFANDPAAVNISSLVSPIVPITSTSAQVKFRNKYATESTFDGMVLEISVDGGGFSDIIAAGGSFVSGGYNATISSNFSSPIAGRQAWSGSSGGYVDTVVNLPASLNGHNAQLRWRMASDVSVGSTGVNVDGVSIINSYSCATAAVNKTPFDFDGDHKTDISIFRPNGATPGASEWWLQRSSAGLAAFQFGTPTDIPVPGDYTGDGKADVAFWRPSTGQWFILRSEDSAFFAFPFGSTGDIPVPADYDGDGKTDAAVFRPSSNTWFIQKSSGGTTITNFGSPGDLPIAADFDGDGKADIGVFRPSGATPGAAEWWIQRSTAGLLAFQFGTSTDKAVPGDYTGDGKADIAFWRPSTGQWFVLRSEDSNFFAFPFGAPGDIPVPGDYDGDGKFDAAVFRPSGATWFINGSTAGVSIQSFGASTDVPVPSAFVRN